jgi:predicted small secreted protein
MKGSLTKRLVYLMILGMFSMNFLTACNTVAGAGKDIEAAGDKIDDTATKEKND